MDATNEIGLRTGTEGNDALTKGRNARFIVVCELLMRVDHIADLPPGQQVVKTPKGDFIYFQTDRIPSDRLLNSISEGRIYAKWGTRMDMLDEVDPDWAITAYTYQDRKRTSGLDRQWPWKEWAIRTEGALPAAAITTEAPAPKAAPQPPAATPKAQQGTLL